MKNTIVVTFLVLFVFSACQNQEPNTSSTKSALAIAYKTINTVELDPYWYQGKAEISRYSLSQNRYQDVHPGNAVMVFVTEDFLTDKQVKNDNYRNPNAIPILKNNMLRTFTTGLYDYSMMSSVFTPIQTGKYPQTLKVTTSSQEWCGHTYMQINWRNKAYQSTVHSYFEGEADHKTKVEQAILEDEIFNRIRMNPATLPIGKSKMLPSTMVIRLLHQPFEPYQVVTKLEDYQGDVFEGAALKVYTIDYPKLNRTVEIVFENKSPYLIAGWTDSYPSVFDKKMRTTTAKRTHTIQEAYWNKNSLSDTAIRAQLGY